MYHLRDIMLFYAVIRNVKYIRMFGYKKNAINPYYVAIKSTVMAPRYMMYSLMYEVYIMGNWYIDKLKCSYIFVYMSAPNMKRWHPVCLSVHGF